MFIVNPLSGARMDNLFSTHPNPENRIAALLEQAQAMGVNGYAAPEAGEVVTQGPWGRGASRRGPWG